MKMKQNVSFRSKLKYFCEFISLFNKFLMYDLGLAVGFVNIWANEEENKKMKTTTMTYLGSESPKA